MASRKIPSGEPGEEERRALAAFLAYRDAPGEETEAALLRAVPGEGGRWLRDAAKRLTDQPSLWDRTLRRLVAQGLRPPEAVVAHVVWSRTLLRRAAERAAGATSRRPAISPDEASEEEVLALDAYLSHPNEETEAALLRAVPGEGGRWLRDAVKRLWDTPSLWASAPPPVFASLAPVGVPARHRPAPTLPRRSATGIVVTVAVVLVVLAAAILTVTFSFSGRSPRRVVTNLPAAPALWRLAGVIDQATWRATGSAGEVGLSVSATCPSGSDCYADEPGNSPGDTVVEGTTDGGSTWQASPLPTGSQVTSALSCPTVERCLAGSSTGLPATSATLVGGTPSVLLTTDGGATWSADPLPAGVAEITNLACISVSECVGTGYGPSTTASSVGPPVAVVTTDGGSSWMMVALPGPFVDNPGGLACPSIRSCVLVGATSFSTSVAIGAALYTSDGGQSWSPAVAKLSEEPTARITSTVWRPCWTEAR